MKKKASTLPQKELIQTLDYLYTAASSIKGRDAVTGFLKDLLTPSERVMLGRRIWIARLLLSGMSEYRIQKKLKVGPNTVYRVKRWLEDQMPGYETAIRALEAELSERALRREAKAEPYSYAALKRKYPLHFLLFPDPKPKREYRD